MRFGLKLKDSLFLLAAYTTFAGAGLATRLNQRLFVINIFSRLHFHYDGMLEDTFTAFLAEVSKNWLYQQATIKTRNNNLYPCFQSIYSRIALRWIWPGVIRLSDPVTIHRVKLYA
jgi:hypothetical protein